MFRPASVTPPLPAALTFALPRRRSLLEAQEAGVDEDDLRQVAAEVLGEVYFGDNGRRAHGLEVELKDLVALEFELQPGQGEYAGEFEDRVPGGFVTENGALSQILGSERGG
jgi:hypothetical protein